MQLPEKASVALLALCSLTITPLSVLGLPAQSYPRAFPQLPENAVASTKALTDLQGANLINRLEGDGNVWLQALRTTQTHPPPALNDPKSFLQRYNFKLRDSTVSTELVYTPTDAEVKIVGIKGTDKIRNLQMKAKNPVVGDDAPEECPYSIALSPDGATLIIKDVDSAQDTCTDGTTKLQFEDIMSYATAYINDDKNRLANQAAAQVQDRVANSIKPIKRILRDAIKNPVTVKAIKQIFNNEQDHPGQWRSFNANSQEFKALLATRNGTLGPKILGTNMKTLHSGQVTGVHVQWCESTMRMVFDLDHSQH